MPPPRLTSQQVARLLGCSVANARRYWPTLRKALAAYLKDHDIALLARRGDWQGVRRAVNGGLNGWNRFHACVQSLEHAAAVEVGAPR